MQRWGNGLKLVLWVRQEDYRMRNMKGMMRGKCLRAPQSTALNGTFHFFLSKMTRGIPQNTAK